MKTFYKVLMAILALMLCGLMSSCLSALIGVIEN